MMLKRGMLLVLTSLFVTLPGLTQSNPGPDSIEENPDLVRVNVTVVESRGRPVTGLPQEAFLLFEEGVGQDIEYFSRGDNAPLSIGIVFDVSLRTTDPLNLPLGTAMSRLLLPFVNALNPTAQEEIPMVELEDTTTLVDGAFDMLETLVRDAINPRKVLLLISDARSTRNIDDFNRLRDAIRESDVGLYAIGIADFISTGAGRELIRNVSEETGGQAFFPSAVSELEGVLTRIATELRNQYVLGYRSVNSDTRVASREVEVRLDPSFIDSLGRDPGFRVRYRRRHFAN